MEEFEKKALAVTLRPGFRLGTLYCLKNLHRFLEHINSLHSSINLTLEMQKEDKTIPFLYVYC